MNENEFFVRGFFVGITIVLPFLGITIAKWKSWKGWSNFWQMMNEDLKAQNERLFRALKEKEETK